MPFGGVRVEELFLNLIQGCVGIVYESGRDASVMLGYGSSKISLLNIDLHDYSQNFISLCISKDGSILGSSRIGFLIKLNDHGALLEDLQWG